MTREHWIATLARVFCGIVFLVHGTPKILNLEGTAMFFSHNFGVPAWLAIPIAILEFFGGILLVTGFLTRILAGLFALEMIGAITFVHFRHGWDVFQGGYEFNVALILLLAIVMTIGPGPISIDGALARRRGDDFAPEEPPAA
jgi:putative oxidoreductase